jgi:hypothetical protein
MRRRSRASTNSDSYDETIRFPVVLLVKIVAGRCQCTQLIVRREADVAIENRRPLCLIRTVMRVFALVQFS